MTAGSDELAAEEVACCRAFGAAGPLGAIEADQALLEEAVAVLAPSAAQLEHALALLALGRATREAGRWVDARTPLGEALDCRADAVAADTHREIAQALFRTENTVHLRRAFRELAVGSRSQLAQAL